MKKLSKSNLVRPLVVAAVHSPGGLRVAGKLAPGSVDVVEVRVDALRGCGADLERFFAAAKIPILLTVRHPAEGGIGNLSVKLRRELFAKYLPLATMVDIELCSVPALRDVIAVAKKRGVRVVISQHHFRSTPTLAQMRAASVRAFAGGAEIFKLACLAETAGAVARLLDFTAAGKGRPLAVMGMGKLGLVSRLALACAGSVLNYGFLDAPNAPGQWEARELKALLGRLGC